tara:strand:- start:233 stop:436 length:204 start_codon:yes stop_codon:yes gene_type:complete
MEAKNERRGGKVMAKLGEVLEATMKLSDSEMKAVLTICREDEFFITLYPRYSDRIIGVIQYTQQNSN